MHHNIANVPSCRPTTYLLLTAAAAAAAAFELHLVVTHVLVKMQPTHADLRPTHRPQLTHTYSLS
ncbi:hypothetical protein BC832DRAFT_547143, partial [Gaertneriomyces semiglobifer]